jgi:hypothetical protein
MFYNCKKATLAAVRKEEGIISLKEKILLGTHLLYCRFCRRFVRQMDLLRRALLRFEQKNETGQHLIRFSTEKRTSMNTVITEELKKGD